MTNCRWFVQLVSILFILLALLVSPAVDAQENRPPHGPIYQVHIDGIVTTITTHYLERALDVAEANNATALLIRVGSEGAVLRVLPSIAMPIADATIPVVVYISPAGTESGATGAFLLSAAHIAAMAPQTSFGTPTSLAAVDQLLSQQTQQRVANSVAQQLREWNERQGRNGDWVDQAVQDGIVLTNERAFATNPPMVNLVAQDTESLLMRLEGQVVTLANGTDMTLHTLGRTATPIEPTMWEQLLLWLSDPTTAFLLLIFASLALYAELLQPGMGVFALLALLFFVGALVGLIVLPIRWLSLVGLLLAIALFAVDLFVPTFGGLTVVGLVLLVISSFTLIDTAQAPNVMVALWAILLVVVTVITFAAVAVWLLFRLRNRPISTGQEGLVGKMAHVRKPLDPEGMVFVEGALWRAICEDVQHATQQPIEQGEWVRIVAVQDLRLIVQRTQITGAQPYTIREHEEI